MAFVPRRTRPQDSIPTASMADVAFLLLIFFLVTTVFPKDKGLAIVLPDDEINVPAQNVLHLSILPSGLVEVRQGTDPRGALVSVDRIAGIWRTSFIENPLLIAGVKTSPEAPYERMIDVLDQLHLAGAKRISLRVLES